MDKLKAIFLVIVTILGSSIVLMLLVSGIGIILDTDWDVEPYNKEVFCYDKNNNRVEGLVCYEKDYTQEKALKNLFLIFFVLMVMLPLLILLYREIIEIIKMENKK